MVIRIGMISFAHLHAYSYAECLKRIPERVEISGIFDEDRDRGRAVGEKLGVPFFESCDRLLHEDIQGVILCAENAKHKDYTLKAAEAGKHILCEKPISVSMADSQAMIDACKNHNVQLMIAFPCRYSTALYRTRQLVREARLGRILGMKGTNHGTMPGGWFIQKELSGGGAVIDHTVHVVDFWRWMLEREVVSVYAEAGKLFYPELPVEDAGLLALEFEGDIFATLDTSWSRPNRSFPTWGDFTLEIVGDQGSITVDAFKQQIEIFNNKKIKAEWACWTDDINRGLIEAFLNMIEDGTDSPISGYDGLKAMEVAIGAYRSLETGEPVSLPLRGSEL